MNVVPLSKYKSRPTVRLLEALLEQARKGQIIGLAVCYRLDNGMEDDAISGFYSENKSAGAAAALRLSVAMATARGEYDLSP